MAVPDDSRRAHQAIMAAAEALLECVRAGPPGTDLGRLRMNLAAVVRDHLATQQGWFAEARTHFADRIVIYDRIMEQDRELRLSYSQHIRQWTGEAIGRDFAGYAADVEALVKRLDKHLRTLESELYQPMMQRPAAAA